MSTDTWYFWKWAANRVDGQPSEVCAALAGVQDHPAARPFDPEALIEKLEQARSTLGIGRSKWRWKVVKDSTSGLAHHVTLHLPPEEWGHPSFQAWIDHFLPLGVFGWNLPLAESFPGTLPKHHVWEAGNTRRYEVKPKEVSRLLREIGYGGTVLLMNHRNDYANVAKAYGRYTVEWRHYPNVRKDPGIFSHWRAAYRSDPAKTAMGKIVERQFIPSGMADVRRGKDGYEVERSTGNREYELLTPGDAAYILRAFLRGESRPEHFHWVSITRQLKQK